MSGGEIFEYARALPRHIAQICEIENQSFSSPWSELSFSKEFEDGLARYFIAKGEDNVVGYCGYWSIVGEAHITNIAVHPDYRGRGIGGRLMQEMLNDIEALGHTAATLEVREDNYPAIRLYERYGFTQAGMRKNYYEKERKNALIMWKTFGI